LRLLEAQGLSSSSRLEISSSAAASKGAALAPPEEVLNFAQVCALSPEDVVRAAAALENREEHEGDEGCVRRAAAAAAAEGGRDGLLMLQHAISEAGGDAADDGGSGADRVHGAAAVPDWQKDAVQRVIAGRQAISAAVCRWIEDALSRDASV